MANRRKPPALKLISGTDRPDRQAEKVFPDLNGEPIKPTWLSELGSEVWDEKVAVYKMRGQAVRGFEGALAQYCELEADMRDQRQRKVPITMAQVNAHRLWCHAFYDEPTSLVKPVGKAAENKFLKHGRR